MGKVSNIRMFINVVNAKSLTSTDHTSPDTRKVSGSLSVMFVKLISPEWTA